MWVDVMQGEVNGQNVYTPLFGFKKISDNNIAADIYSILKREEECSEVHLGNVLHCINDEGWLVNISASTTNEAAWGEIYRIVNRINKIEGVKASSLIGNTLEIMI